MADRNGLGYEGPVYPNPWDNHEKNANTIATEEVRRRLATDAVEEQSCNQSMQPRDLLESAKVFEQCGCEKDEPCEEETESDYSRGRKAGYVEGYNDARDKLALKLMKALLND